MNYKVYDKVKGWAVTSAESRWVVGPGSITTPETETSSHTFGSSASAAFSAGAVIAKAETTFGFDYSYSTQACLQPHHLQVSTHRPRFCVVPDRRAEQFELLHRVGQVAGCKWVEAMLHRHLIVAIVVFVLPGCRSSAPSPASPPSSSSSEVEACRTLTYEQDDYVYTQLELPRTSRWDVTYAVLTNECDVPIEVTSAVAKRSDELSVVSWDAALPPSEPVVAARPVKGKITGGTLPVSVPPGESVQVVATARISLAAGDSTAAPVARLQTRSPEGTRSLELRPRVRFCACTNMP